MLYCRVNNVNLGLSAIFGWHLTKLFKSAYTVGIKMLFRNPESQRLQGLGFERVSVGILGEISRSLFCSIQSTTCNRLKRKNRGVPGCLSQLST